MIEANPQYAHVKFGNGCESTVSTKDLVPRGNIDLLVDRNVQNTPEKQQLTPPQNADKIIDITSNLSPNTESENITPTPIPTQTPSEQNLRRSTRVRQAPKRNGFDDDE